MQKILKNPVNNSVCETVDQKEILNRVQNDSYADMADCHPRKLDDMKKSNTSRKKAAFTLVEVLIVIAVVGVVSALTIPNLIHTYKAKQLRTQFDKSYSMLKQMYKLIEADDVSLNLDDPTKLAEYQALFKKYIKGCSPLYSTVRISAVYKVFNANRLIENNYFLFTRLDDGAFQLMTGETLILERDHWVSVDINGINRGPNQFGYDLFMFQFLDDGIYPMGHAGTFIDTALSAGDYCSLTSTHTYNGFSCAEKAATDPDYFKWVVKNIKN